MAWKCEMHTMYQGKDDWASNGLRFATKEESDASGAELMSRWYVPDKYRSVEVDEAVNYRFDFERNKSVRIDK